MELQEARTLAERIVERIRPFSDRVEIAGSIRREKAEVKDIEICVREPLDWGSLLNALGAIGQFIKPGVPDVIPWPPRAGAKYLRMMLPEGIKLDLFFGTPKNWGALFAMRTGSGVGPDGNPFSGFIPVMFSRWKKISGGGRMTECMPTLPSGEQIPVPEEEDFFALLGVTWVHPRNRASSEAVRAALIPGHTLPTPAGPQNPL